MASTPSSIPANEKKSQSTGPMAAGTSEDAGNTYISRGQILTFQPLTARINAAITTMYNAGGLYLTSLFSLDPYNAAMNSRFNTRGPGRNNMPAGGRTVGGGSTNSSSSWFGFGSGGGNGGSGSGSGGNRPGGRRFGTVDDVRGPECGSCQ